MFNKLAMFVLALFVLAVVCFTPAFAQIRRFEDQSLEITSKLPPQYLGWKVEEGSTTQTVPMYYKVTAYIPGIGETKTSPVATAYSTYAGLCSTNSLRLMWAETVGATYYKLYRSADNTSFYYITSPTALTYVDEGIANGAAFSAASPRGGNLTVENSLTVAGFIRAYSRSKAQICAIDPGVVGEIYFCNDCVDLMFSTGTAVNQYQQASDTTAGCNGL